MLYTYYVKETYIDGVEYVGDTTAVLKEMYSHQEERSHVLK